MPVEGENIGVESTSRTGADESPSALRKAAVPSCNFRPMAKRWPPENLKS